MKLLNPQVGRGLAVALCALVAACVPSGPGSSASSSESPSVPAVAPAATPTADAATPDFDGDGLADVAFTALHFPSVHDLRIRYGSGRLAVFTPVKLTDLDDADLRGPVLANDFNADGYSDLLVRVEEGIGEGAKLYVLFGSSSGLQLDSLKVIAPPPGQQDGFAGEMVILEVPVRRLFVGLTGPVLGSGEPGVAMYALGGDGLPGGDPVILTPGTNGVPVVPTESVGTHFGGALAASGNRVFVGADGADLGTAYEAGAVVALTFDTTGVASGQLITQDTPGVEGSPGLFGRFGGSIAARDGYLAVGAPYEEVGKLRPGAVHVFTFDADSVTPVGRIAQSSPGIPGKDEDGDWFGSSVDIATVCAGVPGLVVGARKEVIRSPENGSAWIIPLTGAAGCSARQLYPGHGLPGKPVAYRELGAQVAVIRDRGSAVDDVVIAGEGQDYFSGPRGQLIVWSGRTGTTVTVVDDSSRSIAGR